MATADEWVPENEAVWHEKIPSQEPGKFRTISLRHPTYQYEDTAADLDDVTRIAAEYLRKVEQVYRMPELFHRASSMFRVPLSWLPIVNDPKQLGSFKVQRYQDPANPTLGLVDQTAILLAVQSFEPNKEALALRSRLGVRIVAHVSPQPPLKVRISSSSCSTELAASLDLHVQRVRALFPRFLVGVATLDDLPPPIRLAANLSGKTPVSIDGLRVRDVSGQRAVIDMYMSTSPTTDMTNEPPYGLVIRVTFEDVKILEAEPVAKSALIARARRPVKSRLFRRDPASEPRNGPISGRIEDARPNRGPDVLQRYCFDVVLPGLTLRADGTTELADDLGEVKVMQSPLVATGVNRNQVQVVKPADVTQPRMNAFAALSGYQHARELFGRMRSYGLMPAQYFRLAALPLLVRYRDVITPGPGKDGKTINAQVDYDRPGGGMLRVSFALANLKRSVSSREPLGLTADPRWSWHEFCHVLLAASTGELELPFVHSVGDALAAIISDPTSGLKDRPGLRGLTFPWVYLNRRHDRSVKDGWSWCGTYHRPLRFPPSGPSLRHKGYESEQILSTSLFQLYLILGGDTSVATVRLRAADYVVYLIMRAIALLGPASAVPCATADQLVSALIDADVGTLPVASGPLHDWVGGVAHKVVRWAFEAQGLYATTDPLAVVDAPGYPPDVDIFIDNGRPPLEGKRGGYMPVSLDWSGAHPPWHATAITINGGQVTVGVRNRGPNPATGVKVRVFWADFPDIANPPTWGSRAWTILRGPNAPQDVPAGPGSVPFGPFTGLPVGAGRRLILAEASCAADRANSDRATGLPCATLETPIVDLVAGDNNLGLVVQKV
jgi:hypothetical protein